MNKNPFSYFKFLFVFSLVFFAQFANAGYQEEKILKFILDDNWEIYIKVEEVDCGRTLPDIDDVVILHHRQSNRLYVSGFINRPNFRFIVSVKQLDNADAMEVFFQRLRIKPWFEIEECPKIDDMLANSAFIIVEDMETELSVISKSKLEINEALINFFKKGEAIYVQSVRAAIPKHHKTIMPWLKKAINELTAIDPSTLINAVR